MFASLTPRGRCVSKAATAAASARSLNFIGERVRVTAHVVGNYFEEDKDLCITSLMISDPCCETLRRALVSNVNNALMRVAEDRPYILLTGAVTWGQFGDEHGTRPGLAKDMLQKTSSSVRFVGHSFKH